MQHREIYSKCKVECEARHHCVCERERGRQAAVGLGDSETAAQAQARPSRPRHPAAPSPSPLAPPSPLASLSSGPPSVCGICCPHPPPGGVAKSSVCWASLRWGRGPAVKDEGPMTKATLYQRTQFPEQQSSSRIHTPSNRIFSSISRSRLRLGWEVMDSSQHWPSFLRVPSTAFLCFAELYFRTCPLYVISLNLAFKL